MIALMDNPNAVFVSSSMRHIDCDVLIDGEYFRYTASADDTEPAGRALYAILALDPSKIAPYVPPKVAEPVATEK